MSDPAEVAMTPPAEAPMAYQWIVLVVLTCLSGMFSGLNLGLMSLTVEDLNIIIASSDDAQQIRFAKTILPMRRRGNLLLCTLLIGNTLVNVSLAVLTDPIWTYLFGTSTVGAVLSLALPSAIIVVLGEIVPQSVCSRHALSIGARTIPITYLFVLVTLPLSYPISVLLDWLLEKEISNVYTGRALLQLIRLNVTNPQHAKESGLTQEDGKVLVGALTYKDRTVGQVMTPLDQTFALPLSSVLDQDTFREILSRGHTRIPVYEGEKSNLVAILLAKNLLGIGFERALPLRTVLEVSGGGRDVIRVHKSTPLNVALDLCKAAKRHLLVVTEDPRIPSAPAAALLPVAEDSNGQQAEPRTSLSNRLQGALGAGGAIGIATIEDFLEEILGDEIVDETDVYSDNVRGGGGSSNKDSRSSSGLALRRDTSNKSSGGSSEHLAQLRRENSKKVTSTSVFDHLLECGGGKGGALEWDGLAQPVEMLTPEAVELPVSLTTYGTA
eukprot:Tamp_06395.p1 GENE.Tamp_06395~~Tamp_06395.p1  ORF type:complete len:497 (-),score=95.88 Tamp_06395:1120-2610(-)